MKSKPKSEKQTEFVKMLVKGPFDGGQVSILTESETGWLRTGHIVQVLMDGDLVCYRATAAMVEHVQVLEWEPFV